MSQELETIKQNVIKCTKCDLCKTRTNAVPGKGNFQSDVIFVGRSTWKKRGPKMGEPFIGVAGKKLSIALDEAGISRDDSIHYKYCKVQTTKQQSPKNK